ncbi:MAG TPA: hypothetical protein VMW50_13150 [Dehalococcoidia bacterium]|nr:hypothetical protein [Dehalococcoidia bacterium]
MTKKIYILKNSDFNISVKTEIIDCPMMVDDEVFTCTNIKLWCNECEHEDCQRNKNYEKD